MKSIRILALFALASLGACGSMDQRPQPQLVVPVQQTAQNQPCRYVDVHNKCVPDAQVQQPSQTAAPYQQQYVLAAPSCGPYAFPVGFGYCESLGGYYGPRYYNRGIRFRIIIR